MFNIPLFGAVRGVPSFGTFDLGTAPLQTCGPLVVDLGAGNVDFDLAFVAFVALKNPCFGGSFDVLGGLPASGAELDGSDAFCDFVLTFFKSTDGRKGFFVSL